MLFRIDLSWYFESFGCLRIWRSSRSMIARLTFVWNKQIFFIYCLFYEVILLNSRPLCVGTYYYLYWLRWDDQCGTDIYLETNCWELLQTNLLFQIDKFVIRMSVTDVRNWDDYYYGFCQFFKYIDTDLTDPNRFPKGKIIQINI